MRLIWRFIAAKADIAVRAEDLRVAEFGRERVGERLHRAQHHVLVHRLVAGPVRLGVVRLKALVELQGLRWPSAERHCPSLRGPGDGQRRDALGRHPDLARCVRAAYGPRAWSSGT